MPALWELGLGDRNAVRPEYAKEDGFSSPTKHPMTSTAGRGHRVNKILLVFWITTIPILAFAQAPAVAPGDRPAAERVALQAVSAPGGHTNYYIMKLAGTDSDGNQNTDIEVGLNDNSSFQILVKNDPSSDPKRNLTNFSNLNLSPDSKTLYFETDAWVTEHAIHAVDLSTKSIRFVISGELACVVLGGRYQGDLVVEQHRYFVQAGSHDDLYLFAPDGKELGMVAEGIDDSHVCPLLSD